MNKYWLPVAGIATSIAAIAICNRPTPSTPPVPVPAGLEKIGPMNYRFEVKGDTFIIYAKGDISFNEADAFNEFRKSWEHLPTKGIKRLALSIDSNGGSIAGAADLAEWVRGNKVETMVPNDANCLSACVMVWGAGYHKWASETAKIGVHNASGGSGPDKLAADAQATLFMAKALAKEGAPESIIGALTITESKDMHWLKYDDAVAWGATMVDKNGKPL